MHRTAIGAHVALALALVTSAGALAQYEPVESDTVAHPAHIHIGLCPIPDKIVGPLADVSAIVGVTIGAASGIPVEGSSSTVDLALSDLVAADHAVVVHLAHEQMATLIACGDVGGHMRSATQLVIGLGPVDGSGYSGIALLTDRGDGATTVDVFIAHSGAEPVVPDGTPGGRNY